MQPQFPSSSSSPQLKLGFGIRASRSERTREEKGKEDLEA
jgi:hypothetical protein